MSTTSAFAAVRTMRCIVRDERHHCQACDAPVRSADPLDEYSYCGSSDVRSV